MRPRALVYPLDLSSFIPTVSIGVTSAVVYTYGFDDGRIWPTHCAVIVAGLGDRCHPRRADRTPPVGGGSARLVPAAASRPGSTIDPGGLPPPNPTRPSAIAPCGCQPGQVRTWYSSRPTSLWPRLKRAS